VRVAEGEEMSVKRLKTAIFLAAFFGLQSTPVFAIDWQSDYAAALEQARQQDKYIMIDFFAEWCHWCKVLDEKVYSDAAVQEAAGNFVCVKIDADKNRSLMVSYSVRGLPTIVFLNSRGEEVQRIVGGNRPASFFAEMMKRVIEGEFQSVGSAITPPPDTQQSGSGQAVQLTAPANVAPAPQTPAPEPVKANEPHPAGTFQLQGIMADASGSMAIINDSVVKQGSRVSGADVVKIESGKVTLSYNGEEIVLTS